MSKTAARLARLAGPRVLLALAIAVGVLGMQSGRGTLAYFTSTASNSGNQFTAGKIVLDNATIGTGVATPILSFTSGAAPTTSCLNDDATAGTFVAVANNAGTPTLRPMVPGDRCAAKITISDPTTNLDAFYNITLSADDVTASALNQRLSNLMVLNVAQTSTCLGSTDISGQPGYQSKAIGGGGGTWQLPAAGTAIALVGVNPLTNAAPVVNAQATVDYCVQIYLPRNGGAGGASYTNAPATTVQGGARSFIFTVNAAQKPNGL